MLHNRISAIVGGLGLFAAVLGFTGASVAPSEEASYTWGTVMVFGIVAFFFSLLIGSARRSDKP